MRLQVRNGGWCVGRTVGCWGREPGREQNKQTCGGRLGMRTVAGVRAPAGWLAGRLHVHWTPVAWPIFSSGLPTLLPTLARRLQHGRDQAGGLCRLPCHQHLVAQHARCEPTHKVCHVMCLPSLCVRCESGMWATKVACGCPLLASMAAPLGGARRVGWGTAVGATAHAHELAFLPGLHPLPAPAVLCCAGLRSLQGRKELETLVKSVKQVRAVPQQLQAAGQQLHQHACPHVLLLLHSIWSPCKLQQLPNRHSRSTHLPTCGPRAFPTLSDA